MNLDLGTTVSSVIASDTKPRDVYSSSLQAGRPLIFDVSVEKNCVNLWLYKPGTASIERERYTSSYYGNPCSQGWEDAFTPAVSGAYYLAVEATDYSDPYTLRVSQK